MDESGGEEFATDRIYDFFFLAVAAHRVYFQAVEQLSFLAKSLPTSVAVQMTRETLVCACARVCVWRQRERARQLA